MTNGMLCGSLSLILTAAASADPPDEKSPPALVLSLPAHSRAARCVRFSPDGKRLAVGYEDGAALLYDAVTGKRLRSFEGHATDVGVGSLAFTPDGRHLAVVGNAEITVYHTATGRSGLALLGHTSSVSDVTFSPCRTFLAAVGWVLHPDGAYRGEVRVWHARTGKQVASFPGHGSVAYSPDGKRLASGSRDGTAVVSEVASGQTVLTLRGHRGEVWDVQFSPDGRRLASTGSDGQVRIWDLPSGKAVHVFTTDMDGVECIVFHPDGRRLIAAGIRNLDRTGDMVQGRLWVWDLHSGQGRVVLRGTRQDPYIFGPAFSPDGTRLATAHVDGRVRVWSVNKLLGR